MQRLWQETLDVLEQRFHEAEARNDPGLQQLVQRWQCGEANTLETLRALVRFLLEDNYA